jgi:hypothetical protein
MRRIRYTTVLSLIGVFSMLAGCANPFDFAARQPATASATVEIAAANHRGKTIVPQDTATTLAGLTDSYVVTLSRSGFADRVVTGTSGPFSVSDLAIG